MKSFLFILLNLTWVSAYSQKINRFRTSILFYKQVPLSKGYYNASKLSDPLFQNKNAPILISSLNEKNETSFQYDPFLMTGLENKNPMLKASSLQGHLGHIRISCSYFYDETGRLVDAISSWNFGH